MKKYLILVLVIISVGCKLKSTEAIKEPIEKVVDLHICPEPIIIRDTVLVTKKYDSLEVVIKKKNDSLFVERFKIERVKYYNKIAQNNPTQLKFLRGWINRVVGK